MLAAVDADISISVNLGKISREWWLGAWASNPHFQPLNAYWLLLSGLAFWHVNMSLVSMSL